MDRLSKQARSRLMSRVRSSGTKIELKLKPILERNGFIYQGKIDNISIDFINHKRKIALFIDGCFWHSCPVHGQIPKSNRKFWVKHLGDSIKRDQYVNAKLKEMGWRVIRIWEHQLK